jgi:mannose-6-phosphate isomerase-like protein (cupin superfamily)
MHGLAASLESASAPDEAAAAYLERLVEALRGLSLTANRPGAETIRPDAEWRSIFSADGDWRNDPLLASIEQLRPSCRWFRADSFYSEPEHRHFSESVWGSAIVGEQDALFDSGGACIALLIVIAPHITYPLHAHRIEEAYLMLSGSGDWSHDGENWQRLSPGSVFHNRSWQPHSMRSRPLAGREAWFRPPGKTEPFYSGREPAILVETLDPISKVIYP